MAECPQVEESGHAARTVSERVLRGLCWLLLFLFLLAEFGAVYQILTGRIPKGWAPRVRLMDVLHLLCLVSAVGVLVNRRWGPTVLRLAASWTLALQLPNLSMAYSMLVDPMSGFDAANMVPAAIILGFALLYTALMWAAHIVVERRVHGHGEAGEQKGYGRWSVPCIAGGVGLAGVALVLRWQYAEPYGSRLLVVAAVMLVIGQCLHRGSFVVATAPMMAGVPLVSGGLAWSLGGAVAIWGLPLAMGIVGLVRVREAQWLRGTSVFVPAAIIAIACTNGRVLSADACWRFEPPLEANPVRPPNFPDYIHVPPDATIVQYASEPTSSGLVDSVMTASTARVRFEVEDPYPQCETLDRIRLELGAVGFNPLQYSLIDPDEPSSHQVGWQVLHDKGRDVEYCYWVGAWANARDDVVRVFLSYSYRPRAVQKTRLRVTVDVLQAGIEPSRIVQAYRKRHPAMIGRTGVNQPDVAP